mgnify:CR=1 FL=1|tara:strand:- start:205 stop:426 length:222 start_codon:yes stop_codon:yes gene_type:complete
MTPTPKEKAKLLFDYHNEEGARITHVKLTCLEIVDEIYKELDIINELVEWDDDTEKEKRYNYWDKVKIEILKK